jgi:hypothetical protein
MLEGGYTFLKKSILAIGIIFLFNVSAVSPVVSGNTIRISNKEINIENYNFNSYYVSEIAIKEHYRSYNKNMVNEINEIKGIRNRGELNFFNLYEIVDFGQTAWGLTSADFNNDGNVDFAVSWATCPWTLSRISIFYNDGNLGFTQDDVYTIHYNLRYIADLDSGDYDNDGDIDLMFTYNEYVWYGGLPFNVNGTVNILYNDGENNFGNETMVAFHGDGYVGNPENRINPQLTSADYDMDGDIDFLVGDNSGKVEFYVNDGTGNFTSAGIIHDWGWLSRGLASADFDNDGDIDLLVSAEPKDFEGHIYYKENQIIPLNLSTCFEPGPGEIIAFTGLAACLIPLDYENNGNMDVMSGIFWNIWLFLELDEFFFIYKLPTQNGYGDHLYVGALTTADYNNDGYDDFISGGVQGIVRLFINIHNFPPDIPGIDGPLNGRPWKKYTFTALSSDRDGDNVSYLFNWGDDSTSGWTKFVPSGTPISRSHRWLKEGTYTVKVRAKDDYGSISDWAELEVTMPRNKIAYNTLFLRFLERYPLLNRLLILIIE